MVNMAIMASGNACDAVAQDGGHALICLFNRDIQPWFIPFFFDTRHPCHGPLTPVKAKYPLTIIT